MELKVTGIFSKDEFEISLPLKSITIDLETDESAIEEELRKIKLLFIGDGIDLFFIEIEGKRLPLNESNFTYLKMLDFDSNYTHSGITVVKSQNIDDLSYIEMLKHLKNYSSNMDRNHFYLDMISYQLH